MKDNTVRDVSAINKDAVSLSSSDETGIVEECRDDLNSNTKNGEKNENQFLNRKMHRDDPEVEEKRKKLLEELNIF